VNSDEDILSDAKEFRREQLLVAYNIFFYFLSAYSFKTLNFAI